MGPGGGGLHVLEWCAKNQETRLKSGLKGPLTTQDSLQRVGLKSPGPKRCYTKRKKRELGPLVLSMRALAMPDVRIGQKQQDVAGAPRTLTGKRPTEAALQREYEYMDWFATLPPPARDDEVQDDSWAAFMAARRKRMEGERLEQRNLREKLTRHARGLLRKPPGQVCDAPAPRTLGRPIDRNSKRQRLLTEREQRREEKALKHQQRAVQLAQKQQAAQERRAVII